MLPNPNYSYVRENYNRAFAYRIISVMYAIRLSIVDHRLAISLAISLSLNQCLVGGEALLRWVLLGLRM